MESNFVAVYFYIYNRKFLSLLCHSFKYIVQ